MRKSSVKESFSVFEKNKSSIANSDLMTVFVEAAIAQRVQRGVCLLVLTPVWWDAEWVDALLLHYYDMSDLSSLDEDAAPVQMIECRGLPVGGLDAKIVE